MKVLGLAPILLFLLLSCSNKEENELATVHFSFHNSKVSSTKHGAVSNPSTASDLDCVFIFATHPDKDRKATCYNSDNAEIGSFTHHSTSIGNGGDGKFEVDAGDNIELQVIAFSKDDTHFAHCPNFLELTNDDFENYISAMYVVTSKNVNLEAGDNNVTFQSTFTPSDSIIINNCTGLGFSDIAGCGLESSYALIDFDFLSCNYQEFQNRTGSIALSQSLNGVYIGLTSSGYYYKLNVTNNVSNTMTFDYEVYQVATGTVLYTGSGSTVDNSSTCLDLDQSSATPT